MFLKQVNRCSIIKHILCVVITTRSTSTSMHQYSTSSISIITVSTNETSITLFTMKSLLDIPSTSSTFPDDIVYSCGKLLFTVNGIILFIS